MANYEIVNYEIVLRNETSDDESPVAGSNGLDSKDTTSSGESFSGAGVGISKGKVVATAIVATGVKLADQTVMHKIQTVSLRTGAEEHQERLSLIYSVGKRIGGSVVAIGAGAAFGGPLGAAAAAFGVLISGIFELFSYSQKSEQLRLEQSIENVGLGYLNIRAGGSVASFSGSRLGRQ